MCIYVYISVYVYIYVYVYLYDGEFHKTPQFIFQFPTQAVDVPIGMTGRDLSAYLST